MNLFQHIFVLMWPFCAAFLVALPFCGCNQDESGGGARPNAAFGSPEDVPALATGSKLRVSINTQDTLGELPILFRPGVWPLDALPPAYIQHKLFTELKIGTIQLELGHSLLKESKDLADVRDRLATLDSFLMKIKEHGGELVLGFSKFPRWLSSRPTADTPAMDGDVSTPIAVVSPPRDYDEWAELMETIATHMKRLGIVARYQIGWEPDTGMWQGSPEEFFQLYKYAVLGVRRGDPNALIGGPAVSDLGPYAHLGSRRDTSAARQKKQPDSTPLMERFIAYCSRTPLPELDLPRLPLDFISVHRFGGNTFTTYPLHAALIRGWLESHGYPLQTEIFIGEWSDTPAPFSPMRERPDLAAFIVANLVAMDDAGINRQTFTCLTEQMVKNDTQFCGGFGLFTRDFVMRPSYSVFKALSELPNMRLRVTSSDPCVAAVAARNDHRIAVLVANFVPPERLLPRRFAESLMYEGYPVADLRHHFKSLDNARAVSLGKQELSQFELPEEMEKQVLRIRSEIQSFAKSVQRRAEGSSVIALEFEGIDWSGPCTMREYRIDSTHANPIRRAKQIDDAINKRRAEIETEVNRNLPEMLQARQFSDEEAKWFNRCYHSANPRRRLAEYSTEFQQKALAMSAEINAKKEAKMAELSEKINQHPDVRFQLANERELVVSDAMSVPLSMEPNSVLFVVLEKP